MVFRRIFVLLIFSKHRQCSWMRIASANVCEILVQFHWRMRNTKIRKESITFRVYFFNFHICHPKAHVHLPLTCTCTCIQLMLKCRKLIKSLRFLKSSRMYHAFIISISLFFRRSLTAALLFHTQMYLFEQMILLNPPRKQILKCPFII